MRGGYSGIHVPLSPSNFQGPSQATLPPFGPVKVPTPGITQVHDGEYYFAHNNRVIGAPKSTNSAWGKCSQKGGRKRRKRRGRKRRCPKTGKPICYCPSKHKSRGRQRGGASSTVINAIPGGTDVRGAFWGAGNKLGNLWDNWNGFGGRMSPSPNVQPIGISKNIITPMPLMPQDYTNSGLQASKSPYTAYN